MCFSQLTHVDIIKQKRVGRVSKREFKPMIYIKREMFICYFFQLTRNSWHLYTASLNAPEKPV